MATISKLQASNGYYGHSGDNEYTTASASNLYVGKESGTSSYRSRLTFPATNSCEEVGTERIRITGMELYIYRNESTSNATSITIGCSSSSAWDATLDASITVSLAKKSDGYTIDISDLASAISEYSSKWYLHISSSETRYRSRFDSTGSGKKNPYINFAWERVAATITGDTASVDLGNTVTFSITPEVTNETHTLTYFFGDTNGTIATKQGNSISWTPPLSLASEIPCSTSGLVEIRMTAYDASNNVQRTETYYQTVTVPSSIGPSFSTSTSISAANTLRGYVLAGVTNVNVTPVIDMTGAYGAEIVDLRMNINSVSEFVWTNVTESSTVGVFTGSKANTGTLNVIGTNTIVITVTDSRGRTATKKQNYGAREYSLPVITDFDVFR